MCECVRQCECWSVCVLGGGGGAENKARSMHQNSSSATTQLRNLRMRYLASHILCLFIWKKCEGKEEIHIINV